jgi:hypothetical protein
MTTTTHAPDPRLHQLHAILRRVQSRLRIQEATLLIPLAAALGLGASVLLAVIWRVTPMMPLPALLATGAGLVVAASLTALIYTLVRPRDLMSTARKADLLLSLDERLSTALEDAAKPPANPSQALAVLREAQLDDALASASRLSPQKDLPLELDRKQFAPAGVMLALLLAAIFVPAPFQPSPESAVRAQVGVEQKKIEALKQQVQANPRTPNDPTLQELLKELEQLSRDLSTQDLSREEALARLSETESELQKALDPQAPAERAALDELAKQLAASNNPLAKDAGEALKAGDPEKAREALDKAADNLDKMTPEEQRALADSLRQARDNVVALDPGLAGSLDRAASALEQNDPEAAKQALKDAAQQINDTAQDLASQEQVRQALSQLQQSKTDIAQAGRSTPVPGTPLSGTAIAQGTRTTNGTPSSGTPISGTPLSGTAIASLGSPVTIQGTPVTGTPVALGSPVTGRPTLTGTPVLALSTGTPIVAQGQGQGQSNNQGSEGGNSGDGSPSSGWGTGHKEPVYAPPSSVNANLTPVSVQGQDDKGEQTSAGTNTDANSPGAAQVPYEQVYGEYKERAGNALGSDYIPQGYKDLVRDYFTEIEPPSQP